jgi:plastocyanin
MLRLVQSSSGPRRVGTVLQSTLFLASILMVGACDRPATTEVRRIAPASVAPAASSAANDEIPLVRFGENEHGSPFPPPDGHDRSTQAQDLMIPRTVVINAGGRVQFEVDPFHRVNVYRAGTVPSDIDLSKLINFSVGPVFIPNFVIDDPTNRIAQSPGFSISTDQLWTTPVGTFAAPGRYLVICSFLPHFAANGMYGWVIVR